MNSPQPEETHLEKIVAERPGYYSSAFEEKHESAGIGWMSAAVLAFAAFAGFNLIEPIRQHAPIGSMVGRTALLLALPLIVVGLLQTLHGTRTQKARAMIFCFASVVFAAASITWSVIPHKYFAKPFQPDKSKFTALDFRRRAVECMSARDLDCAQEYWSDYIRLKPADGKGVANLAIVLNMRDLHTEAVEQFKKAIELGEGAYDLFAYYADSLEKLDQVDAAIDWNYRALSVYPNLVDVRGKLASLLVRQKRQHEALAILQTYDEEALARGEPPYFAARRISIESSIADDDAQTVVQSLRIPMLKGHYFVPVKIGDAPESLFVVDTGATFTTMNDGMLSAAKVRYRVLNPRATLTTADRRIVVAQAISIDSLRVGPFLLTNVNAVVCGSCLPLLGQSTLAKFNMQSSHVQGVEFLTLTRQEKQ